MHFKTFMGLALLVADPLRQTWKMSIHLSKQSFFNPKSSLEARKLRQNKKKYSSFTNTILLKLRKILINWAFATKERMFKAKLLPQLYNFTRAALAMLMTFSMSALSWNSSLLGKNQPI